MNKIWILVMIILIGGVMGYFLIKMNNQTSASGTTQTITIPLHTNSPQSSFPVTGESDILDY